MFRSHRQAFRPDKDMDALFLIVGTLVKVSGIARLVKKRSFPVHLYNVSDIYFLLNLIRIDINQNVWFVDLLPKGRYGVVLKIECRDFVFLFDPADCSGKSKLCPFRNSRFQCGRSLIFRTLKYACSYRLHGEEQDTYHAKRSSYHSFSSAATQSLSSWSG